VAYRKFQFAGIVMDTPATHDLNDLCGGICMEFSILVTEMAGSPIAEPVGEPFTVGTVSVCRVNLPILDLTRGSFFNAIDETACTYEWATHITDNYTEEWDLAHRDKYVLEQLSDFIGIESVYIDEQFRSKGLLGLALRGIAAVAGFGMYSAMVLVAQPWAHLDRDGDLDDPKYVADLKALTKCYERIGFNLLCKSGVSNVLTLVGMYKNKKWEKLWPLYSEEFRVKNFDRDAIIFTMAESRGRKSVRVATPLH